VGAPPAPPAAAQAEEEEAKEEELKLEQQRQCEDSEQQQQQEEQQQQQEEHQQQQEVQQQQLQQQQQQQQQQQEEEEQEEEEQEEEEEEQEEEEKEEEKEEGEEQQQEQQEPQEPQEQQLEEENTANQSGNGILDGEEGKYEGAKNEEYYDFHKHSLVEARWQGGNDFFHARVHSVNADGTFDVHYGDGGRAKNVKAEFVRPRVEEPSSDSQDRISSAATLLPTLLARDAPQRSRKAAERVTAAAKERDKGLGAGNFAAFIKQNDAQEAADARVLVAAALEASIQREAALQAAKTEAVAIAYKAFAAAAAASARAAGSYSDAWQTMVSILEEHRRTAELALEQLKNAANEARIALALLAVAKFVRIWRTAVQRIQKRAFARAAAAAAGSVAYIIRKVAIACVAVETAVAIFELCRKASTAAVKAATSAAADAQIAANNIRFMLVQWELHVLKVQAKRAKLPTLCHSPARVPTTAGNDGGTTKGSVANSIARARQELTKKPPTSKGGGHRVRKRSGSNRRESLPKIYARIRVPVACKTIAGLRGATKTFVSSGGTRLGSYRAGLYQVPLLPRGLSGISTSKSPPKHQKMEVKEEPVVVRQESRFAPTRKDK
jgi:hypothetical protein